MRMMKKVLGTVTVLALSVSLLAGCGSTAASPVSSAASTAAESATSSVVSETTSAAADENEAAAAQLLNDLTGSYQELWPVILADEYKQTWLDDCTALVGEENAEAAFEKLSSMVTSDVYGEDAVEALGVGFRVVQNLLEGFGLGAAVVEVLLFVGGEVSAFVLGLVDDGLCGGFHFCDFLLELHQGSFRGWLVIGC